jgi:hypothetical protein
MGAIDFRTVDLNLLAPLRVLLVERHVTRSAEKLGISQPAMSASLGSELSFLADLAGLVDDAHRGLSGSRRELCWNLLTHLRAT